VRLREDGTVVTVLLSEPFRDVPDAVVLNSADREKGLLLGSVSSPLPEPLGGHTRTGLKVGQHAA
jgi:hypothetical protein